MSLLKHLELLREAELINENERRLRIRNYHSASEDLKKLMDKDPQAFMNYSSQQKSLKTIERISNNVLFFFVITLISLIVSALVFIGYLTL